MVNILFYASLRASELCNLDIGDLDLQARSIRVREGKGGQYGLAVITQECADVLREYLAVRLKIKSESPALFLTERGNRWDRMSLSRMVAGYKKRAGINKPGAAHVLARHSVASILIKNGASLSTVQHVLRHRDLESTTRYIHLSDSTKQAQYDQYLRL
jgi:site-specific recombinase XerD